MPCLPDLERHDTEYRTVAPGFVCVESGNVNENMIHLPIGGRHETTVTIGVEKV